MHIQNIHNKQIIKIKNLMQYKNSNNVGKNKKKHGKDSMENQNNFLRTS